MPMISTRSADSKMKFWLILSERYSEKCLVPTVCFGRSFSAIDEKYELNPSLMSAGFVLRPLSDINDILDS